MAASGFAGKRWSWKPPTEREAGVRLALVHAAAVLSTRDRQRPSVVLSIDMRPLVLHSLHSLERIGIERTVVAIGENAAQIVQACAS